MYNKVAVAIIHGIGNQNEDFAKKTIAKITKKFTEKLGKLVENPASQLVIQPVLWAPVFKEREESLVKN